MKKEVVVKQKKRVMFVIGTLGGGGAERVLSILANGFTDEYEVSLVCIFSDEKKYKLDDKVNYIPISIPSKFTGLKRNIVRLKNFRKIVKENAPEVIISFLTPVNMFCIFSLVGKRIPIIVSERGNPNQEVKSKIVRFVRNSLYYCSKKIHFVFQTPYAQSQFMNCINKRSRIIYNPIKRDIIAPYQGERRKTIVSVSRLEWQKNIPLLLNAFSEFNKRNPEYDLEIYGDGSLKVQMIQLCRELNIVDKVKFKGFVENIHESIKDASMFVLSSDCEGISNAMIEALALGLPVICTDCPVYAAKLFIEDGKNGFLTEINNSNQMCEKMLKLAEDDELKKRFSSNARNIRNILEETNILKQWKEFVEELTNGNKN